ncbi:MAG: hypothetical protein HQK76_14790 [Desulfobacterales bacterium]|nr:hypothetical protein [Desulfobacterales bacterium]
MAPLYAKEIGTILDITDQTKRAVLLDQVSSTILLSLDPITNKPLFEGLELELMNNEKIVERPPKSNFSGFVANVLITSEQMHVPIGIFHLYYSSNFFEHIRKDSQTKLFQWVGAILFTLIILWYLLVAQLKPLSALSAALRDWKPGKDGQVFPPLSKWISKEIQRVQRAIEELIQEQEKARELLEERVFNS